MSGRYGGTAGAAIADMWDAGAELLSVQGPLPAGVAWSVAGGPRLDPLAHLVGIAGAAIAGDFERAEALRWEFIAVERAYAWAVATAVLGCACLAIGPQLVAPGTSGRPWRCDQCGRVWTAPPLDAGPNPFGAASG